MSNKIYLSTDITEESFQAFSEALDAMEERKQTVVQLILNSAGGNAMDALAFCGRMRTSLCKVNVLVCGLAGSAAVLVLAAGNIRRMTKESWLYVHEDSSTFKGIQTTELEKQAAVAKRFEEQWAELLEELTGTKAEVWADLHKRDLYLTPNECVTLGIVDEII